MTSIIVAILLLTVAGAIGLSRTVSSAPLWSDLRVHFSVKGESDGFFQLPRTAADARQLKYTSPSEEAGSDLETLCPDQDPSVCVVFDSNGNVAGIDIGIFRSDVDDDDYPNEKHLIFVPKVRFGYDTYITRLFFVEPKTLTCSTPRNLAKEGTGTGLWLQMGDIPDQLFQIPRKEADIAKTTYVKQNCLPGMGVHYYYNMSTSMDCQDFEPIFGLFKNSEMIGFGFQTYGRATPISKVWFEDVPTAIVRTVIPNAPQCLFDSVVKFGVISLHVYFVDQPWTIQCSA